MPNPDTFSNTGPLTGSLATVVEGAATGGLEGFYETMRVVSGVAPLLPRHVVRLRETLRVAGLNYSGETVRELLENRISEAWKELNRPPWMRFRFTVQMSPQAMWKSEAGELDADPWCSFPPAKLLVFGEEIPASRLLKYKRTSRDLWLRAFELAQTAGLDDALLLCNGKVAETAIANVFRMKNGVLITPPYEEMCLAGVARGWVLDRANALGIPVREEPFTLAELLESDEVFTTNALRGITAVAEIGGQRIAGPTGIVDRLM